MSAVETFRKEAEKYNVSPEQFVFLKYVDSYLAFVAWCKPKDIDRELNEHKEYVNFFDSDFVPSLRKIAGRQIASGIKTLEGTKIPVLSDDGEFTPEYEAYLTSISAYLFYTAWDEPRELERRIAKYRSEVDAYWKQQLLLDLRDIANFKLGS